ncbi:hypothetical protein [Streptomyces avicenniae]|uniref:hypothetical protein n=1 Tax=Streptomyces avicenniae TaxID=500153 RepID=UPI000AFB2327|nr:hypothetical protein [Streptomyces avicenniae]
MLSGTSCDAVDAAVADLAFADDATVSLHPLGMHSEPYPAPLRAALAACLPPAAADAAAL